MVEALTPYLAGRYSSESARRLDATWQRSTALTARTPRVSASLNPDVLQHDCLDVQGLLDSGNGSSAFLQAVEEVSHGTCLPLSIEGVPSHEPSGATVSCCLQAILEYQRQTSRRNTLPHGQVCLCARHHTNCAPTKSQCTAPEACRRVGRDYTSTVLSLRVSV